MTVTELKKLIGKPSQVFKIHVSIGDHVGEEDFYGEEINEVDLNCNVWYNNDDFECFTQTFADDEIDYKKIEAQAKRWTKSLSNTYRKVSYEGYENC